MKRTSRLVLITLIFTLPLALIGSVKAGTCPAPGPACYEYWKTDVVFVGLVTEISHPEIAEGENWAPASLARFSVEDAFRGVKGKEIEIAASKRRAGIIRSSTDDMGYRFEKGQRYLVYAHRSTTNKWVWSSICSRTRPLAEAAGDLKYIRGLSRAKPGGTILGTVWRRGEWIKDDQSGPVSGIKIIVKGENGRFESKTDSRGEYRVSRLRLGTYKVGFVVPRNFVTTWGKDYNNREVSVTQDRGCVEATFEMSADGGISGRVTDTDGRPVPGVNVEIVAAGFPEEEQQSRRLVSHTEADGRYELRPVPPGSYLLGINIAGEHWGVGYDRSYYPGVSDANGARIISIAEGQRLSDYDLSVPRVTARRTITGVVYLSHMRPAAGALVALESSEDGRPRWDLAVRTDEQGRFSITEHDSYIVWVHARYTGPEGEARHAEPIRLEKRVGEVSPLSLEVTMPGTDCTHYRSQE